MSKEIREMIDKVKSFKQFVNENANQTLKVDVLNPMELHHLVRDGHDFKDETIENRIEFFNLNNITDSTTSKFENSYYIVLSLGDKIIGVAKVGYYSKNTSVVRFFSIDKEYRGSGYSRLMADALFKEAKNRGKNIATSLYTELGKSHLQHLFQEYAKKYGVKFIDRKENDPLYKY